MPIPPLVAKVEVDQDQANREIDQFARDNQKKIDQIRLIELRANTDSLDLKLFKLREELKRIKAEGRDGVLDERAFKRVSAEIRTTSSELTEAKRRVQNLRNTGDETTSRLQAKFDKLGGSIGRFKSQVLGAVASIVSGRGLVSVSNSFTNIQNRLKQVSSGAELGILQKKIFNLAQDSRVSMEALTASFVRFDLVNRKLGGTQEETLVILDSLSKGLSASGATASEVSSVMLQLSQAFGSGILAGDEFRSVAENMPGLLDVLAERLGVARGELKEMAADGLITSEVLKGALIDANEQLNESFQKTSVTIGQALTQATNAFIIKFGELDQTFGITEKITSLIGFLTKAILTLGTVIGVVGTGLAKAFEGVEKIVSDVFKFVSKGLSDLTDFIKDNLKIITALFISSLVTLRREAIKNFIVGTIGAMVKGTVFLTTQLPRLTFQILLQTKALTLNTIAKTKNAIASFSLAKAGNILSLSFLRTRAASLSLIKTVLTLASRFFFVGTIFAGVAIAIFKNWDTLKSKLSGIFQLIASAGDAGANIVASAWNTAVSIVAGAAKLVLNSAAKVVSALNLLPKVDIDVSGITNAVNSIDSFAGSLKITGQDVKGTFASIGSGAKGLIDDFVGLAGVGGDLGGLDTSLGDLGGSISDLSGGADSLGESLEGAGEKGTKASQENKEAIEKERLALEEKEKLLGEIAEKAKETYSEQVDEVKELEESLRENIEAVSELREEYKELRDEAVDALQDINQELKELDRDEDVSLAERQLEIQEERIKLAEELGKTTEDAVLKELDAQLEGELSQSKRERLEEQRAERLKRILEDLQFDNRLTGEQAELKERILELDNERALIEENITEAVLNEAKAYEELNEAEKILFDNAKARKELQEQALVQTAVQEGRDIQIVQDDENGVKALVENEKGELIELQDFKNTQDAIELQNQRALLQSKELALLDSINAETVLLRNSYAEKAELEQFYTGIIDIETTKRIKINDKYIKQLQKVISLQREAGVVVPNTSSSNGEAITTNNITNNIEVNNATAGAAVVSTQSLINNITAL